MLALTRKTDYGLIAMTHLARLEGDELACAREIARLFHVPVRLLMNVLKQLSAAGYVESVRGSRGGYRLARRPESINLAEVVTALEGPMRLVGCLSGRLDEQAKSGCKLMEHCPIADPVNRVQQKLGDFLRALTLADIVQAGPLPAPGQEV